MGFKQGKTKIGWAEWQQEATHLASWNKSQTGGGNRVRSGAQAARRDALLLVYAAKKDKEWGGRPGSEAQKARDFFRAVSAAPKTARRRSTIVASRGTRQGRAGTIAVQANSRQQQSMANVSRQEEESSCLRAIAQLSKEAAERSWLAKAARLRCSRKRRHPVGSR